MDIREQKRTEKEILTLSEASEYLKIAEKTLQRMIKRNEIPSAKVGGQYRFMKSVIDDWLLAKMQVLPGNDLARLLEQDGDLVPIYRLAHEELVVPDLEPAPQAAILERLTAPLVRRGIITNSILYIDKLLERERMASTATNGGVAFPHVRRPDDNPAAAPAVVVGICRKGTRFGAEDLPPVKLFFLPCTDSEVVHLRLLQKLGRILRQGDSKERLIAACDAETVMRVLIEAEKELKERNNEGN